MSHLHSGNSPGTKKSSIFSHFEIRQYPHVDLAIYMIISLALDFRKSSQDGSLLVCNLPITI